MGDIKLYAKNGIDIDSFIIRDTTKNIFGTDYGMEFCVIALNECKGSIAKRGKLMKTNGIN